MSAKVRLSFVHPFYFYKSIVADFWLATPKILDWAWQQQTLESVSVAWTEW
jgi:hypothetical protein